MSENQVPTEGDQNCDPQTRVIMNMKKEFSDYSENDDDDTENQCGENDFLDRPKLRTNQFMSNKTDSLRHDSLTDKQLESLESLIQYIINGNYQEFQKLLNARGFKNMLNVFINGQTPLHYSLIYGRNLSWCKQLVTNGANPNLTNLAGWHPIHLAAYSNSRETMRYLIEQLSDC